MRIFKIKIRILQCGESLCEDCILKILNKDSTGLNCSFCNEFHRVPHNGFSKNQRLSRLLSLRPSEVFRGKAVQNFKLDLKLICEKSNSITNDLTRGSDKIKEYCEFIRNDVDLAAESWLESIHKFRDEFFQKIDTYERECLKNFENFSENDDSFRVLLEEADAFYQKWTKYLEQFSLDKIELSKGSNEAKVLLDNLQSKEKDLKCKLFNGKLLKFEYDDRKVDSQIVGQFKYQYLKINFDQLRETKVLPLKSKLTDFHTRHKIAIEHLSNGNVIIAHQTTTNNVNLVSLDKHGEIMRQKTSIIPIPNSSSLVYNIKLVKIANNLFMYVWYFNINFGHRFCLVSYDENSNLRTKVYHDYPVNGFAAYDNYLYVLSIQNGVNKLSIVDSNLESISNFGQKYSTMPFFFPLTLNKIQVNESLYFLLDNNTEIRMMNRADGLILKSFRIDANDFTVYLDQFILAFKCETRKLYSFNFNGKLETDKNLENITQGNQLIEISEDELIFYDSNQVSLNFLNH